MPPKSKRPRESPQKNVDRCLLCTSDLEEDSKALLCDGCGKWMCCDCLKISDAEYELLVKMQEKNGFNWDCAWCKSNVTTPRSIIPPQPAATIQDITTVITQAIGNLQSSLSNTIAQTESALRAELGSIKDKVNSVEVALSSKCSVDETKQIVQAEVRALSSNFQQSLESEVQQIIRAEKDRESRKNNIVVYGIDTSIDDTNALKQFLSTEYGINCGPLTNVRRLKQNIQASDPTRNTAPPLLFTVSSFQIKKQILKESLSRKGAVQFRHDRSKQDQERYKALVAELKDRIAGGEKNLAIRDLRIVSKNAKSGEVSPLNPMQM